MDKRLWKDIEIRIGTSSEEDKIELGNKIHEQLVGNPDYVDSNIVLNIDEPNVVCLVVFKECLDIPKIEV